MDNYNKELGDKRERIEDIEEKISEKTSEIKRLNEEIDNIQYMKRNAYQVHGEILEDWEGEDGFKKLYEANEEMDNIFTSLVRFKQETLEDAEAEKKTIIRELDELR